MPGTWGRGGVVVSALDFGSNIKVGGGGNPAMD